MHVHAPQPPASGIYAHACPRSQASLGLGRRDRPRPAASTHVMCTDHPASVSHKGKRSGPLMHILHTCISVNTVFIWEYMQQGGTEATQSSSCMLCMHQGGTEATQSSSRMLCMHQGGTEATQSSSHMLCMHQGGTEATQSSSRMLCMHPACAIPACAHATPGQHSHSRDDKARRLNSCEPWLFSLGAQRRRNAARAHGARAHGAHAHGARAHRARSNGQAHAEHAHMGHASTEHVFKAAIPAWLPQARAARTTRSDGHAGSAGRG
eukprot:362471-Chlamydomonas_euryale.AAC.1